jgi:hypothetical protein
MFCERFATFEAPVIFAKEQAFFLGERWYMHECTRFPTCCPSRLGVELQGRGEFLFAYISESLSTEHGLKVCQVVQAFLI